MKIDGTFIADTLQQTAVRTKDIEHTVIGFANRKGILILILNLEKRRKV